MELPFPGMNPYLEAPSFWPDVHHRLITVLCDQILAQLQPHYTAVITPYVAFENLEITPVRVAVVPHVGILETDLPAMASTPTTVAPAPLIVTAAMHIPTRYTRLEIRTVGNEALVTAIELLSPVNKRPGVDGVDAYEQKRQELFRSEAHLLELESMSLMTQPWYTPFCDKGGSSKEGEVCSCSCGQRPSVHGSNRSGSRVAACSSRCWLPLRRAVPFGHPRPTPGLCHRYDRCRVAAGSSVGEPAPDGIRPTPSR